ncbi:MAG TPA: pentapeptide repeat-containing protein [Trichocoleus sp.]
MRLGKLFQNLFSIDTLEGVSDTTKTVFEFAEKLEKPEIKQLVPIITQGASLLEVLNSPMAELAESTLPFVKVATGLLKFYLKVSQKEPTLAEEVVLVSQAAYLESLQATIHKYPKFQAWLKQKGKTGSTLVKPALKRLADLELEDKTARIALVYFQNSPLAQAYNDVLATCLEGLEFPATQIRELTARVTADTPQYMLSALAELGSSAKRLLVWYQVGGQATLEKYLSIETYLEEQIRPRPLERVFSESFTFREIYVPQEAQLLLANGEPDQEFVILEDWAIASLNDDNKKDRVLFVQGGPGRGKSVFCRMIADRVRQHEPGWIPILIRLRDVRSLEKDFEETLRKAVDRDFSDSDPGWLTDRNLRFLFVLDGFDELLMEGRTSGGLEEFLRQVGRFQESCAHNSEKQHRVLITGRSLSLQNIERLMPSNLERVEILPLDNELQEQWFTKWGKLVHADPIYLKGILNDERLPDQVRELAREPLLLYLLAAMHRDGELSLEMFEGAEASQAKVLIYEKAIDWALTKQRPEWLNRDLTELETASLRRILSEAGLCVVQAGGECAPIAMIESRLRSDDAAKQLLETARDRLKDNPLRNALAAFYLQPGKGSSGSVEFVHKSFSEFLCAERLKEAIEDWSTTIEVRNKSQDLISDEKLHWQIYDLLGYGGLTVEIVDYLFALLSKSDQINWVRLFKRLEDFYFRWSDGEFIDAPPENLPQQKMRLMKEQLPTSKSHLGLRQVDVYTGLNILILLFSLHRYAQSHDDLQENIHFHPCSQMFDAQGLLRTISYGDCVVVGTFQETVLQFLSNADLTGIDFRRANFFGAVLSDVSLRSANLFGVDLSDADLSNADLSGTLLYSTVLHGASLTNANISNANMKDVQWDKDTNWEGVRGWRTAQNLPEALRQQLEEMERQQGDESIES